MGFDMTKLQIPYGVKDGTLYAPLDVPNGDDCGCRCPNPKCNGKLRANHGKPLSKRRAYFSHQPGADCAKAYESAVHLFAKQVIKDEGAITLPEQRTFGALHTLPNGLSFQCEGFYKPSRWVSLSNVVMEKKECETGRKPDITARYGDEILYIEICVTHPVSKEKSDLFVGKNLMEIDLSGIDRDTVFDREALRLAVLKTADRHWCHCQLYLEQQRRHESLENERYLLKEKELIARERKRVERNRQEARFLQAQEESIEELQMRHRYRHVIAGIERMSHDGIEDRRRILLSQSQEKMEVARNYLNLKEELPAPIGKHYTDDWVFNEHCIVWQLYICALLRQEPPNIPICPKYLSLQVVNRYKILSWVEDLIALREKYQKDTVLPNLSWPDRSSGIWFFNHEENLFTVDPHLPIVDFMHGLCGLGMFSYSDKTEVFTLHQPDIAKLV